MKLAWVNDIHLNFVSSRHLHDFVSEVTAAGADGVLIGGDIGEADSVVRYLETLAELVQTPIYFVLGNHDFYRGSIAGVREAIRELCRGSPGLIWLTDEGPVPLTSELCLLGHDGWADGRFGDFLSSTVSISDHFLVAELKDLSATDRLRKLNALGDEAAAYFAEHLSTALQRHRKVIVLTHVPPFHEAAVWEGRPSDNNYAPHFACKAVGDVLAEAMRKHGDREMLVLCGHTHGSGRVQVLPNLEVITGGATYGKPKLQAVFDTDNPTSADIIAS